jgi:hypothetical protein
MCQNGVPAPTLPAPCTSTKLSAPMARSRVRLDLGGLSFAKGLIMNRKNEEKAAAQRQSETHLAAAFKEAGLAETPADPPSGPFEVVCARCKAALQNADRQFFLAGDCIDRMMILRNPKTRMTWTLKEISTVLGGWKPPHLSRLASVARAADAEARTFALSNGMTWSDTYQAYAMREKEESSKPLGEFLRRVLEAKPVIKTEEPKVDLRERHLEKLATTMQPSVESVKAEYCLRLYKGARDVVDLRSAMEPRIQELVIECRMLQQELDSKTAELEAQACMAVKHRFGIDDGISEIDFKAMIEVIKKDEPEIDLGLLETHGSFVEIADRRKLDYSLDFD